MSASGLDFEDVVGRLRDVHRSSPMQAEALCPAHDDREHRSLSVTARDGRVLVKCFVGCSFAAIMSALGMTRNGTRNGTRGNTRNGTRATLTLEAFAAHKKLPAAFLREHGVTPESWGLHIAYRHRDGRLARQQRRRTALVAKDGSVWIKGAGAPIAYGAWRLDDALERGELHLVEGESNVLAAWYHNLPALGIPGADMAHVLTAEDLAGLDRLYVFRDPDRGGDTFVEGIAQRLAALRWSGQAVVVQLPVKDLADLHVAAGDDFAAQLAAAKATAVSLALGRAATPLEAGADGPVLVTLADVEAEAVEWAWLDRIARGKLGLIVGDPGEGKTSLAIDMSARTSNGADWPDGAPGTEAADVVILTAEDGLADTLRVRLDRQGGNARRVHVLTAIRERGLERMPTLERDLAAIEQVILMRAAKLAIIDPLSAYLGSSNSWKDSEIRALLGPLAAMAERHRVAVVGILHLNKAAQRKILHRAGGSIAFVAAARTVLVVSRDAENPERRLLISAKNNLGPEAPTLAFRISDAGLTWDHGIVEGTAERLLAGDELPSRGETRERDLATSFLRDLLRDGPVPSKQVEADAKANGITQRTLWRAKADMGIDAARLPGQRGTWYWSLPGAAT